MDLHDIDLTNFTPIRYTNNKCAKVYRGPGQYLKMWPATHTCPHTYQDGLSHVWCGYDKLVSKEVDMINSVTCPAFIDVVYDGDRCCGYLTRECHPLPCRIDVRVVTYIKTLVEEFVRCGYVMRDVHASNIMLCGDDLTVIDIDPSPLKLSAYHDLTPLEKETWLQTMTDASLTCKNKDNITVLYRTYIKRCLGD